MENKKQIAIIGAGPAGITAAIYIKRAGFEPVIYEANVPGGKINFTAIVENYPSILSISGPDLAELFAKHLKDEKITLIYEEVKEIKKVDNQYEVITDFSTIIYPSIIIATGTKELSLDLENVSKFEHRGISYCAVCDGPLFRNKDVAVVGGGDAALEEALYLSNFCNSVTLIHRRDEFRAAQVLVDKIKASSVKLELSSVVTSLIGERFLEAIEITSTKDNTKKVLKVNGLFPYIGAKANTNFLSSLDIVNNKGYIEVSEKMETSLKGVYAIGDVINKELRQIVTATNDGAIAGIEASKYLKELD